MQETDILIIGAGQQGLALGKRLKELGRSFLILEAESEVGARWRRHYDSLVLFTPRRYSALPGLPLSGDPDGYAGKDEFADYLKKYAKTFDLPVVCDAGVENLTKEGPTFIAWTRNGNYTAKQVVVATGYAKPFIPETSYDGFALHSSEYKNPLQILGEKVLVVGNGNSASQIAIELSASREVHIAMREIPRMIPRKILGKSFYWWGERLGTQRLASNSFIGKLIARDKDFVVGHDLKHALKSGIVIRRPGVSGGEGKEVYFDDGSYESYDTVIFATGFVPDYSWIEIPEAGNENQGISAVPGLYFAGLRNQVTSISSNIYGAKGVAEHLARHMGI